AHPLVQLVQAALGRLARRRPDDAAIERDEAPAVAAHDAEAEVREAGIDAEYDHGPRFCAQGRMPLPNAAPSGRNARRSGYRSSVQCRRRQGAKTADIRLVLGGSATERQTLRVQLADAEERVRELESQLAERAERDQRTNLLALDAFLLNAEHALRTS